MKKLRISPKFVAGVLSGIVFVSAGRYAYGVHEKKENTCDLTSPTIEQMLEDESVMKLTTLDEEIANENIDIVERDKEFRSHAEQLTYDNYVNDRAWYEENLIWIRQNYQDIALDILFAAGKCSVADELETDMNYIRLKPDHDRGHDTIGGHSYVEDHSKSNGHEAYTNKSKALAVLIEKICRLQEESYKLDTAKDVQEEYDSMINIANDATRAGLSVKDDTLIQRNKVK